MEKFTFFWKSGSPFSQWHHSVFEVDGVTYTSAEQYMMHQKALMFNDTETAILIMNTDSPRDQKALGRQVKPFDAKKWNEHCQDIVMKGNLAKFTQNPSLLAALKATAGTEIVEASPHDTIWGIGLEEHDPRAHNRNTWRGTNWLGEILTQLRNYLITKEELGHK